MMTDTDIVWTGGCLCGGVRYRVSGPPIANSLCYCTACQTIAGGSPSGLVIARRDDATIETGEEILSRYSTTSDAGNPITRLFCSTCGTHLFTELPLRPERFVVKAGTLDDRDAFRPTVATFAGSANSWHRPQFTEDMSTFERAVVVQESTS